MGRIAPRILVLLNIARRLHVHPNSLHLGVPLAVLELRYRWAAVVVITAVGSFLVVELGVDVVPVLVSDAVVSLRVRELRPMRCLIRRNVLGFRREKRETRE